MSGVLGTAFSASAAVYANLEAIIAAPLRQMWWVATNPDGTPQLTYSAADVAANNPDAVPTAPVTQGLTGYVTLQEDCRDQLTITDHPIERGAVITDHAYKMPSRLTLRLVFPASGSSNNIVLPGAGLVSILAGGGALASVAVLQSLYTELQNLQTSRSLVQVYTGKRLYSNMLPESIAVTTDEHTEHVLFVTIDFREIIITQVQTVQVPTGTNPSALANPPANTGVAQAGAQTLQPTNVQA